MRGLSAGPSDRWGLRDAYLVTDDGLLYRGEVLERGQQNMTPLRTSDVFDEATELLAQRNQDLVFILDGLCKLLVVYVGRGEARTRGEDEEGRKQTVKEGDELLASALSAEGEGDGGEAVNRVQAKKNIVMLRRTGQHRAKLMVCWHGSMCGIP